jgi:hypothetical protein
MGWLSTTDRAAGGIAQLSTTLGQIALVILGVHLVGDQIDDLLFNAMAAGVDALEDPLAQLTAALDRPHGTTPQLSNLPLTTAAAWGALGIELTASVALSAAFVLSSRRPTLSWAAYREALSVHALVMPLALAGVLLAGCWSMAMAAEDLLPRSDLAPWAAGLLAAAVGARFGMPAWLRAVGSLSAATSWRRGALLSALLLPVGALAWRHGVPVWGWLS